MDRTRDFLRGRRRSELTAEEIAVLEAAISEVVVVPPRRIIAHRADRLRNTTLLIDGFICRYMDGRDGYRQLVPIRCRAISSISTAIRRTISTMTSPR